MQNDFLTYLIYELRYANRGYVLYKLLRRSLVDYVKRIKRDLKPEQFCCQCVKKYAI